MRIRSEIRVDQTNKEENNFYQRGVLNIPLTIMLPFGLLGLRPGQLFNKVIGCFINLMFLFNYGLVLAVTIARFINVKDYNFTTNKFFTGFAVVMSIKFTSLFYIFFKRYNFVCLFKDLSYKRKHRLSKKELLFVIIIFMVTVTLVIYTIFYTSYVYALPVLRTGIRHFVLAFESNSLFMARTTTILECIVFMNSTWISVLLTGLLINVISMVLRREFEKCIRTLQEKINQTGSLSGDIFSETVERFQELRGMVEKVDDMFFLDVALNLCLPLGVLCSAIFSVIIGEFNYGNNIFNAILVSVVTLLIQLPPSAAMHSKVTVTSF